MVSCFNNNNWAVKVVTDTYYDYSYSSCSFINWSIVFRKVFITACLHLDLQFSSSIPPTQSSSPSQTHSSGIQWVYGFRLEPRGQKASPCSQTASSQCSINAIYLCNKPFVIDKDLDFNWQTSYGINLPSTKISTVDCPAGFSAWHSYTPWSPCCTELMNSCEELLWLLYVMDTLSLLWRRTSLWNHDMVGWG